MLRCQSLGSGHCFLVLSLWVLNVASNTVSSTSSTSLSTSSTVSSTSTSTSSETSTSTTTSTAAPTQSCFERCGEDFSSNPTASCFCDNACEFYGDCCKDKLSFCQAAPSAESSTSTTDTNIPPCPSTESEYFLPVAGKKSVAPPEDWVFLIASPERLNECFRACLRNEKCMGFQYDTSTQACAGIQEQNLTDTSGWVFYSLEVNNCKSTTTSISSISSTTKTTTSQSSKTTQSQPKSKIATTVTVENFRPESRPIFHVDPVLSDSTETTVSATTSTKIDTKLESTLLTTSTQKNSTITTHMSSASKTGRKATDPLTTEMGSSLSTLLFSTANASSIGSSSSSGLSKEQLFLIIPAVIAIILVVVLLLITLSLRKYNSQKAHEMEFDIVDKGIASKLQVYNSLSTHSVSTFRTPEDLQNVRSPNDVFDIHYKARPQYV
eukprot:m.109752 g.109752  ORF g.109752 m.109752 type:complete len:438 (+) comp14012_c0_seq5:275-1588(+)